MNVLNQQRKSRTVRTIAASILLAALMTTAACGDKSKSLNNGSSVESSANGSESTGVAETGTADSDSDTESSDSDQSTQAGSGAEDATSASNNEVKQTTGTYNGLADSHSAEITTEEGVFVYQLTEQSEAQASAIPSNSKVKIEYTEQSSGDSSTRQLTKIEAVKE
ncbi:hypothetical protein H8B09_00730 [Paenibacillus sp. PR3]|uniref:Lipoprotein n=1 Tax=Paenibacillus terricola TaxID=2763503 RepID=A0ABR8MMM0_9BACL|nr:hypothetical protein [Paenibacillus terricola]MBD3917262.1 hypothetical protein [Paenibacillus terricola]